MTTRKTRSYTLNSTRPEPVHQLAWLMHGVFGLEVAEIQAVTGLDHAMVWSTSPTSGGSTSATSTRR
jgi:hypothetical protein